MEVRGLGGFPFCLHVAQDYHEISPRVYLKNLLQVLSDPAKFA
jgi:hypothetical protein